MKRKYHTSPTWKRWFDQKWLNCWVRVSLRASQPVWNSEVSVGSSWRAWKSLSTGFSSVYHLHCEMPRGIKSFLPGSVLSQLVPSTRTGHVLVLLPQPYLPKRCWCFCAGFSPGRKAYSCFHRNIIWATNISHTCNLKFSSCHVKM